MENIMFNPSAAIIRNSVRQLEVGCNRATGEPIYAALIRHVATVSLNAIAHSDALYHNVEHTILVTLVGQEILRGKQQREGRISGRDWAHFIISLLCHDIGYVKGICRQDYKAQRTYATGIGDRFVVLAPGASDACLMPYHVDRSKQVVEDILADQPLTELAIDLEVIKHNIEMTRFPIPKDVLYQNTSSDAGLARAADLIGQLSDPRYLEKIPALFYEFEEIGTNQVLGYRHSGELRAGYPTFFHSVVSPYIQQAWYYLTATHKGRRILTDLRANLLTVEQELSTPTNMSCCSGSSMPLGATDGWNKFRLETAIAGC
jgi:hypothetical protein